ncbi:plasma membrane calcium ATPase [Capsaspora owczarzaki ATCC 30864]|uniref:Calcium-transporting ATPase n=1 Tax=Capsaspora owczarzaki (strain ATCC 30864) TaxID=595528 RepID=A0A0D2WWI6_CAPO3|nr:plasma membrane calcium ATPase [Capsaspora owczarzaki ATCC 30864]KJE97340.1 plasma membrane calcium ATPase [Capsaspora owczarzaki ATCC 30864]|eukprot:XP_004343077.1 plasma membrane calcium ATPase [Capsaspora owczarzaki ATCC 30864]
MQAPAINIAESLGKMESYRSNRSNVLPNMLSNRSNRSNRNTGTFGGPSYRGAINNRSSGFSPLVEDADHPASLSVPSSTTGGGSSAPAAAPAPRRTQNFVESVASSGPFSLSKEELVEIVSFDNRDKESQVQVLESYGAVEGIADKLRVNLDSGLNAHDGFEDRTAHFGRNIVPPPKSETLLELIWDALHDRILQILIVGAIVTLAVGLAQHPTSGWTEGVAILVAVILVVSITAGNDYFKERKFKQILMLQSDKHVTVLRDGKEDQVSSWDIQVGDVVLLSVGEEIPADGIFIRGTNLSVDESPLTGETVPVKKSPTRPFIFSGTEVKAGDGAMLVTTIGELSTGGRIQAMLNEQSKTATPLQEKLEKFANIIGYIGFGAGILTFVGLTIRWIVDVAQKEWEWDHMRSLLDFFVIAITIVVVAVPEGLPLAVTISLAYSMVKMIKDQNFVRHLSASETMGEATCICSDKTGTLTENRMSVVETVVGAEQRVHTSFSPSTIQPFLLEPLCEGIALNSTCFVKYNEGETLPVFVGSSTEGALLVFGRKLGVEYEEVRENATKFPDNSFPFSSDRKRMTTLVKPRDGSAPYRAYTKGASEIVLELCSHIATPQGAIPITPDHKAYITSNIQRMASDGLRTIVLAFRNSQTLPTASEEIESNLIFIALTGIKDPVRPEVPDAVRACQRAGLIVRMVTGDNILTAKKIAQECGILTADGIAIEGPEFRALTQERRDEIIPKLQVLARSSPQDKFDLVKRLKALGEVVAVTGDGTNDAPALKEADVGFAMGQSGTHIAMNASDIVLLDDNFSSIVKAIRWGRNVFDCIRKFLQFQLSVNLVAIVITFVGSVAYGESPLSAVQLLWVNLIMDTFGALALATDEPEEKILERPPHTRDESLVTKGMATYILIQTIWQCILLIIVLFAGYRAVGVDSDSEIEIYTLVFCIFVYLQVCNLIMARHLTLELNPFRGMFNNKLFCFLVVLIAAVQAVAVQVGGDFVRTEALNGKEWGFCIGLSLLSFPVVINARIIVRFAMQHHQAPSYERAAGTRANPPAEFELQSVNVQGASPRNAGAFWAKLRAASMFLSMYRSNQGGDDTTSHHSQSSRKSNEARFVALRDDDISETRM